MNKQAQAFVDALQRQGIAVDVARVIPQFEQKLSGMRLRFDREALRFIHDVQTAFNERVPDGTTLMFTITAPIRMGSKTAVALEKNVHDVLARPHARIDLTETINGNRIRVRLVKGVFKERRAIGFVHNPDCDPEILFDATQALLETPRKGRRSTRS